MTIPTQMSLQGFIATEPDLTFTRSGHPRFYCRVGIEQRRKEVDGSSTKLDPVYCDLVLFDAEAERAYAKFKPGDQFVASGYVHEYEQERPGRPSEIREQFVARRIGHDCAHSRYVVNRGPRRQETSSEHVMTVDEPSQSLGM